MWIVLAAAVIFSSPIAPCHLPVLWNPYLLQQYKLEGGGARWYIYTYIHPVQWVLLKMDEDFLSALCWCGGGVQPGSGEALCVLLCSNGWGLPCPHQGLALIHSTCGEWPEFCLVCPSELPPQLSHLGMCIWGDSKQSSAHSMEPPPKKSKLMIIFPIQLKILKRDEV